MTTQFDYYQKMLNHQRLQTGLMVGQTALASHMAGSLNQLQGEMNAIRQMNLQGLAIQQEMLQRENLQLQLEEFIYNTQKMVAEFADEDSDESPSTRYFSLKGILESVEQLGVGTALIRGRDNKAAFEAAMKDVQRLTKLLEKDPDVAEAIDWAKAEQKRVAEAQRRKKTEQERLALEKGARRSDLQRQLSELRSKRRPLTFTDWYGQKFGAYLNRKPPFDQLPLASIVPNDIYKIVATVVLWGPLPFGICYGCVWIPIMFGLSKKQTETDMNIAVDSEIAKLERELAKVELEAS